MMTMMMMTSLMLTDYCSVFPAVFHFVVLCSAAFTVGKLRVYKPGCCDVFDRERDRERSERGTQCIGSSQALQQTDKALLGNVRSLAAINSLTSHA